MKSVQTYGKIYRINLYRKETDIMKGKRKWLGLLLCGTLCTGLMPLTALAEETPAIWIQGVNILADEDHRVNCGDGFASYDPDSGVLTLNNATITKPSAGQDPSDIKKDSAIVCDYGTDLTIHLVGKNTIPEEAGLDGIFTRGKITITGDGKDSSSLQIATSREFSLYCDGNMTIENVTMDMDSPNTMTGGGIHCGSVLTIRNSSVTIESGKSGIQSSGGSAPATNIESSYLKVTSADAEGFFGMGDVTITNSEVELYAQAGTADDYKNALYTYGTLTLAGSSNVTASSVDSAVFAAGLDVQGSKLTATSEKYNGVYAWDSICISGESQVTAQGGTASVAGGTSAEITAPDSGAVNIYVGESAEEAKLLSGSPFDGTTDLLAAGVDEYAYFRSEVHTHVFDQQVADSKYLAEEATCEEPAAYYYSCECGAKGIETFTSGQAAGHTPGTEWESDANSHWHECADCGDKLDEASHTFEWVIDKEATETNAGSKHERCTVCGYEKAAVEIPATNPNTGVDGNLPLWIFLSAAAGLTLIGTMIPGRKNAANNP